MLPIKEEIAKVLQPVPQERLWQRIEEQIADLLVSSFFLKACHSDSHPWNEKGLHASLREKMCASPPDAHNELDTNLTSVRSIFSKSSVTEQLRI